MMVLHTAARRMFILAFAGSALCGQSQAQSVAGITDDTVKIGISGALTGPVAALGAIPMGVEAKVKAVNAAGGVKMGDGKTRKIELVVVDDALEPQRTMSNARKLVEQDGVFALAGIAGTPTNQAIRSYVNQKKVPNLFVYSATYEWGDEKANPWSIGLVPSFTTEAAVYAEYLKKTKPEAKVGLLYLNTDMGQNFQAGLKAALAGSRVSLVSAQPTTNTDPTVDTQLTNLRASGADTLIVVAAPRQAAQAVKFAVESGWAPKTIVSYAASSIASLRPGGLDNAKGVITGQFLKPIDASGLTNDPGVKRYLADYAAAAPRFEKGDTLGQLGYVVGDALVHVLKSMKAPTREAMMESARNMKNVELDLLLPGVTLNTKGGQDSFPIESLQLFEFDGSTYNPTGGVLSYEGKTPKL